MQNAGVRPSRHDLAQNGLRNVQTAFWNLGTAQLIEQAIQRHEGMLASGGAFVVRTGPFTGRSPKDKYIVRDSVRWAVRADGDALAGPGRIRAGLLRRRR
jgi:phosphoenolpyruvate carboxykinase (ATP)